MAERRSFGEPVRAERSYPGKVSSHSRNQVRVFPHAPAAHARGAGEPLWRHLVGDVLRKERRAQQRTLQDVADAARISMPYLSEVERGRKEASSEVLAAAAKALGLGLADVLSLAGSELAGPSGLRPAGSRAVVPASDAPHVPHAPHAPHAPPYEAGSQGADAAEDEDATVTSVTSVAEMSARRTGPAFRAAPRPGDVRLAA